MPIMGFWFIAFRRSARWNNKGFRTNVLKCAVPLSVLGSSVSNQASNIVAEWYFKELGKLLRPLTASQLRQCTRTKSTPTVGYREA
jgi:hypothetical protein